MAEVTHTFDINECKCSETGIDHAPQVYVDGFDAGKTIQLWFATRPGVTYDQVHALMKHMHGVLSSCHVQIGKDPYAHRKVASR